MEENLSGEHIVTKAMVRKSIYMDTSKKYKRNGKIYRHNCYRADVRISSPDGGSRIRARFKDYNSANRWLEGH